jgi:lipooligosaccharide transport system permease protein
MSLFGGTYFPLDHLPGWAQKVALAMPLYHLTAVTRSIAFGTWDGAVFARIGVFAVVTVPLMGAAVTLMRRRLIA